MDRFDPAKRRAVKAAARRHDDMELAAGRVTPAEMQRRNGAFQHIDFAKAQIVLKDEDPIL
ncbi:hypothetical protein [Sphingomonas sp. ID0503]|uniref:hypothetical protein n=1 Tax=Sphingomonas sp. ID0503 TaxID=3399691 RepID=UPI003AFA6B2C